MPGAAGSARGAFLLQPDRRAEAREAFNRAIALSGGASQAAHIRAHLDRLSADA